jgi:hypothetical protein
MVESPPRQCAKASSWSISGHRTSGRFAVNVNVKDVNVCEMIGRTILGEKKQNYTFLRNIL